MKSVSCNKYETLFITGWVESNGTHHLWKCGVVGSVTLHPPYITAKMCSLFIGNSLNYFQPDMKDADNHKRKIPNYGLFKYDQAFRIASANKSPTWLVPKPILFASMLFKSFWIIFMTAFSTDSAAWDSPRWFSII